MEEMLSPSFTLWATPLMGRTVSVCPTKRLLGLASPLAHRMVSALTPNLCAMLVTVSPGWTSYRLGVRGLVGTGEGVGVGLGVGAGVCVGVRVGVGVCSGVGVSQGSCVAPAT